MTDKEKIERYDSLQIAMQLTLKSYKERAKEARKISEKQAGVISLHEHGVSTAYNAVIKDMERWIDDEHNCAL